LVKDTVDLLRQEQPAVFLLSTGADTLFGLVLPEETYGSRIDRLMEGYGRFFETLRVELPDLVTIVHGYDYFMHLDGVSRKAVRGLLDVFNTRLAEAAARYPDTVRYLDLRGSVQFQEGGVDQWWNAFQPNIDAVRTMGAKFIRLIGEVRERSTKQLSTYSIT
jgi:hypothetical protein